jgi:hypothetical protein
MELPGSGEGTTSFPLPLSRGSLELLATGDEIDEKLIPLFDLDTLVFASRRHLRLRLKTTVCLRSKYRVNHPTFVHRPVTGFTSSINPSDCRPKIGGELEMLMITVESKAHGASNTGYDGF